MISAGVVPVFLDADDATLALEPKYLLLRCFRYWDFPKGGVHAGETHLTTAIRELEEETGLNKIEFIWGHDYAETPVYAKGKIARYYIGRVDRTGVYLPVNPLLGHPEHHEFRWLTYEEAKPLLNARVLAILDWAHRVVMSGQPHGDQNYEMIST